MRELPTEIQDFAETFTKLHPARLRPRGGAMPDANVVREGEAGQLNGAGRVGQGLDRAVHGKTWAGLRPLTQERNEWAR